MRSKRALLPALLLALSSCSTLQASNAPACDAAARTLDSPPGRAWLRNEGWRYATRAEAEAAFAALADTQSPSPWPDWYAPYEGYQTILPPGTRFQMAVGGESSAERPGGFGTFDNIADVANVRSGLAVKKAWKPAVTSVVTFEVTRPLPVKIGPVGPQVDGTLCRLLPGRWSQLQMLVPPAERLTYIRKIAERPIR
ncbi:MAG: hypothetical protein ACJ8ER_11775 [Allosphingosinicella sp.]